MKGFLLIISVFVCFSFAERFNITDLIVCPSTKLNDRNNAAISMFKDEIFARAQIRIPTSDCASSKDRPVLYLSVSQVIWAKKFFFDYYFLK